MTGSLAYRKNEAAIVRGEVPLKYTRLLPFITGSRILEIGSAEGVLALQLALKGKQVTALERSEERHLSALELLGCWSARRRFLPPHFICGDISDHAELLCGIDTLVAVRMIYYLGPRLNGIFAAASNAGVQNIVLCGNRNRADRWRQGNPDPPLGDMNRYAAREGMEALLERHGYDIVAELREGDEIVVGRRIQHQVQNLAA